jgi:hypothetical protein
MTLQLDGNDGITFADGSEQRSASFITTFKNKIINGNFDIWQRGTSQTGAGYGSDDRWFNQNIGSTKTHSQQAFTIGQTEVPGNPKYFSRTVVTSVAGASNFCAKWQGIEDVTKSSGKTMTLSFWAKADASKNIAIEFTQYFGTGGTPSASVEGLGVTTFALTTSWQKFTTTVTFPSISGKTLGTNNDHYYRIDFWFDAGSDWNSRTNSLGQQSGTFDIAQVQLEEGSVATSFEDRPYSMELALCQRYYSGPLFTSVVAPASNWGVTMLYFPQVMRTTPTFTYNNITTQNLAYAGTGNHGPYHLYRSIQSTAAGTGDWTAWFYLSAEL